MFWMPFAYLARVFSKMALDFGVKTDASLITKSAASLPVATATRRDATSAQDLSLRRSKFLLALIVLKPNLG